VKIPVRIGEVLAGKYRVESILGAGAMGVVVAARHVQLGSPVALKFMLPEALLVSGASDRFIREARAAACLRGEHVARVTDFGTLDDGAPYIVMEYLEGSDLDAVMTARGPLSVAEAVGYVVDACEGMDEAHGAGIVHRDLKPKNLFLTRRHDGTPLIKVLDFGISKFTDASEDFHTTSTKTGAVLGSPAFISPEQIKSSKHVDARADIYALGAIVFYLLTKELPFDVGSIGELFGSVLYREPLLLRACRPDAPAALEAVVARCLQKDPNARFSDVRELMTALRRSLEPPAAEPSEPRWPDVDPAFPELGELTVRMTVSEAEMGALHATPEVQGTLGHAAVSSGRGEAALTHRVSKWYVIGLSIAGVLVVLFTGLVLLRRQRPSTSFAAEGEPVTSVDSSVPVASSAPAPPTNDLHDAATPEGVGPREIRAPKVETTPTKRHHPTPPPPASSLPHGDLLDHGPVTSPHP